MAKAKYVPYFANLTRLGSLCLRTIDVLLRQIDQKQVTHIFMMRMMWPACCLLLSPSVGNISQVDLRFSQSKQYLYCKWDRILIQLYFCLNWEVVQCSFVLFLSSFIYFIHFSPDLVKKLELVSTILYYIFIQHKIPMERQWLSWPIGKTQQQNKNNIFAWQNGQKICKVHMICREGTITPVCSYNHQPIRK